jgi:hypothetical protein
VRYYLTEQIGRSLVVIGETVGGIDPVHGSPFPHIMGEGGLTQEQLIELPGGRQALWAWERRDDSAWANGFVVTRRSPRRSAEPARRCRRRRTPPTSSPRPRRP